MTSAANTNMANKTSADYTWRDDEQDFEYVGHFFNIDKAKSALRTKPRPVVPMPVDDYYHMIIDKVIVVKSSKSIKSAKYDLSIPVIVGTLASGRRILLDGWHRLVKARDSGVTELPSVVLDQAETDATRWKRYPYANKQR